MSSINILVEAKKEYTSQLQKILTPRIYEGFKSIYEDIINLLSKELDEKKPQSSSLIKTFQKMLKEIPNWNQDIINNEYSRIEKLSNCDYIDGLIEAVFITNTKILTSVQINDNNSINIKISIPQPSHFVHKCYMECAKEIYKNPYIFDQSKNLTPKEKHNNLRESISLIDNSINNAIRNLLPIRDILKGGLMKNTNLQQEPDKKNKSPSVTEEPSVTDEPYNKNNSPAETEELTSDEETEKINLLNSEKHFSDNVEQTNLSEQIEDKLKSEYENESEHKPEPENESEHKPKPENESEHKPEHKPEPKPEHKPEPKPEPELKKIIYNSVGGQPTVKKLNSIEKIGGNNTIILQEQKQELKQEPEILYEKKFNNPFIKNIKQTKFLKKKNFGLDRNTAFYKKKYEENSANFHSIKESDTSIKISKNNIMLSVNSSDETEDDDFNL